MGKGRPGNRDGMDGDEEAPAGTVAGSEKVRTWRAGAAGGGRSAVGSGGRSAGGSVAGSAQADGPVGGEKV